ncbi:hypothetical protein [Frigoriflavimonas asaccharolytica]|uniref:Lysozyme family protein n=1 Tax=Frigoriflavimonas asaccharolytica TaxID=2735899 RepID=A0A8J8G9L8_9FLAO|nr:hypothetical protein [Frigoriflavimonas asaccharolytica]NRS93851.1 lysozyme family protein [Frigoriflavimonas asaccharolytica]
MRKDFTKIKIKINNKDYEDGGIGPNTIKALNNVSDQDKLLNRIAEI